MTRLLAVYSTYKLRLLITFPPTTRIVLVCYNRLSKGYVESNYFLRIRLVVQMFQGASTSAIALMTLIHPFTNYVPREVYSIEKGHYLNATLVYSLQFICLACTLLLDTKFMLMGYESYLAFKNRADYEYRDGSQGWVLVSYYVSLRFS
jgi:hypothetical protein